MKADRRTLVGSDGSLLGIGEKLNVLEGLGRVSNEARSVYDLWSRARVGGTLPRLADLALPGLGNLQDAMLVIEVMPGEDDYRYRQCGALEIQVRGGDPTGRTVRQCHEGEILDFVLESYDRVVASRDCLIDFSVDIDRDQRYVTTEVMFLPLSDNGADVTHILVYCHYRDTGKAA